MNFLNSLKNKNLKLQLEKLVIGVEEPIFIKGLGNILAKVDSGNAAFNVIHGEDFYYQGKTVVFTAYDEEGHPHKISKKVQDNVTINIGGGHTEDRPVVLFDVKFVDDEYINVPFTVGNRANNKNKVLLGKDFLTKQLDVLIDVNNSNIADKKIEIEDPLAEGVVDTLKNVGNTALNVATGQSRPSNATASNSSGETTTLGKAGKVTKGLWSGFMNLTSKKGKFFGKGGALDSAISGFKEALDEIQKSDKELIFKALNKEFAESGQPIKSFVKNPQVYKILDYLGKDYENKDNKVEESVESNGNVINEANQFGAGDGARGRAIKNLQSKIRRRGVNPNISGKPDRTKQYTNPPKQVTPQEKTAVPEVTPAPSTPESISTPKPTSTPAPTPTPKPAAAPENTSSDNVENKEWTKAQKENAEENAPVLYLVIYDGSGSNLEKVKQTLSANYSGFKKPLTQIMSSITTDFNIETSTALAKSIVKTLKEDGILSNFALCSGRGSARQVKFLATNFQPSIQLAFIKQYCKNYTEELLSTKNEEQIDPKYAEKRFVDNELFGFNKYKLAQNIAGLPEDQINSWLENPDAHDGYDVKAAFNKFVSRENSAIDESVNKKSTPVIQESTLSGFVKGCLN